LITNELCQHCQELDHLEQYANKRNELNDFKDGHERLSFNQQIDFEIRQLWPQCICGGEIYLGGHWLDCPECGDGSCDECNSDGEIFIEHNDIN